jgi:serine/threonine-protein kinase
VLLPATGVRLLERTSNLPLTDPGSPDAEGMLRGEPAGLLRAGRYQLLGEIGRGGMGVVLRGRDPDLGRELAVKVLLENHQHNPAVLRRFLEEAQIGGQLQHPGIVPVHELGQMPDGRPFFAMKLVGGRTLAELLARRADPGHDRPHLLSIFRQVCQAVAYAHSRGVIHRDLKPANIMVGAFGEVQVMDWGLAKVLRGGRAESVVAEDQASEPARQLTIRPAGPPSRPGIVVGTPAYMPPEQASGQTGKLDERCDVFGLGAILCEILTGLPPHAGDDSSILDRAARADLADALARLDACGADPELLDLARRCLAARAADRPRDAGALAAELTGYLESVEARLRQAELARVEAQARAEEEAKRRVLSEQLAVEAQQRAAAERRRRRATLALAAAVLALVVLGGSGVGWNAHLRTARLARLDGLLGQVEDGLQRPDILAAPAEWEKTQVALGQAEEVAAAGVDGARGDRLRALKGRAVQVETTRVLLAELEEIRGDRSEHGDPRRTDSEYEAAFRRAGLDLSSTSPAEAGAWLADRPQPVELAAYLDDWATVRRKAGRPEPSWRGVVETAQLADPDPWRNRLRKLLGTRPEEATRTLRELADDANGLEGLQAESLLLLALLLREGAQDRIRAERVLRSAQTRYPGHFWVYLDLARAPGVDNGTARELYPRPEDAVRYLSAAVALRPRSAAAHSSLGTALRAQEKLAEAVAAYQQAIRLDPGYAVAHSNLGNVLQSQGSRPRRSPPSRRPSASGTTSPMRIATSASPCRPRGPQHCPKRSPPAGRPSASGPPSPAPTPTWATPWRPRGSCPRRSPPTRRPSDSAPISPRHTATSAASCGTRGSCPKRSPPAGRPSASGPPSPQPTTTWATP